MCSSNNIVITPNAYVYYRQDNENSSINSKEKSKAIFAEYEEVDKFFTEHRNIKYWANTNKLIKQFFDYKWNYNRIDDKLKPKFIKQAGKDFKKYEKLNELNSMFLEHIDKEAFNLIMNLS